MSDKIFVEKSEFVDFVMTYMTNLQEAYQKAAFVFVKTVVQGEPTDIMKKLEKCPILENVSLSDDGRAVFFRTSHDRSDEILRVELPTNVKLIKHTKIEYEVQYDE